jgi:hypothetical protein
VRYDDDVIQMEHKIFWTYRFEFNQAWLPVLIALYQQIMKKAEIDRKVMVTKDFLNWIISFPFIHDQGAPLQPLNRGDNYMIGLFGMERWYKAYILEWRRVHNKPKDWGEPDYEWDYDAFFPSVPKVPTPTTIPGKSATGATPPAKEEPPPPKRGRGRPRKKDGNDDDDDDDDPRRKRDRRRRNFTGGYRMGETDQPPAIVAGFRDQRKIRAIEQGLGLPPGGMTQFPRLTNSFPTKANKKKYCLKAVYPEYTYIMDIMECKPYIQYLILINPLTKFVYAQLLNDIEDRRIVPIFGKIDAKRFMEKFDALLNENINLKIEILQSDSEPAFSAGNTKTFYRRKRIQWRPVKRMTPLEYPTFMNYERIGTTRTEPKHTSLSPVDRIIKTIRDMMFNMRIGTLTPVAMRGILAQYHYAPHRGLSELMGFAISPSLMEEFPQLQWEVRRRLIARNQEIYMSNGYDLPIGTKVAIFNENTAMGKRRSVVKPEVFVVLDFNGAFYRLRQVGNNLREEYEPRWRLKIIE